MESLTRNAGLKSAAKVLFAFVLVVGVATAAAALASSSSSSSSSTQSPKPRRRSSATTATTSDSKPQSPRGRTSTPRRMAAKAAIDRSEKGTTTPPTQNPQGMYDVKPFTQQKDFDTVSGNMYQAKSYYSDPQPPTDKSETLTAPLLPQQPKPEGMYTAKPIYTDDYNFPAVSGGMYQVKPYYASHKPHSATATATSTASTSIASIPKPTSSASAVSPKPSPVKPSASVTQPVVTPQPQPLLYGPDKNDLERLQKRALLNSGFGPSGQSAIVYSTAISPSLVSQPSTKAPTVIITTSTTSSTSAAPKSPVLAKSTPTSSTVVSSQPAPVVPFGLDFHDMQNIIKYTTPITLSGQSAISYPVTNPSPSTTSTPLSTQPPKSPKSQSPSRLVTVQPKPVLPMTSPTKSLPPSSSTSTTAKIHISDPIRQPSPTKYSLDMHDVSNTYKYSLSYAQPSYSSYESNVDSTTPEATVVVIEEKRGRSQSPVKRDTAKIEKSTSPAPKAKSPAPAVKAHIPAVAAKVIERFPVAVVDVTAMREKSPVATIVREKSPVPEKKELSPARVERAKSPVAVVEREKSPVPVVAERAKSPVPVAQRAKSPAPTAKSPERAVSPGPAANSVKSPARALSPAGTKSPARALSPAGVKSPARALSPAASKSAARAFSPAPTPAAASKSPARSKSPQKSAQPQAATELHVTAKEFVPTEATSSLRVTAQEFVPMSSNGGSPTTSLRPTAAEFSPDQAFSSGYVSPPFLGGDPLEAYNPYAVPSPTAIPIPMYPDPSTSSAIVPAQIWDPTIGAFIYTYDDYTPAAQLPHPPQPKNGTSTTTNNRSRARTSSSTTSNPPTSKKQSKKKQQNGTTTKEKDSIPTGPTLADFIKVDKKKGVVVVGDKRKGVQDVQERDPAAEKCVAGLTCPKRENGECALYHATEVCKFFPNCRYGEACLYIHEGVVNGGAQSQ